MAEINDIFLESLLFFLSKEKSQRSFAAKLGVSPPYLNDLIMKRRNPEDRTKRKIAAALGYPDMYYEDFLGVGRCALSGETVSLTGPRETSDHFLRNRGVLAINYSNHLTLGPDNKIEVTSDQKDSPVIVYGPNLRRATAENLQAFTVVEKNMANWVPKNSTIIVDLSMTEVQEDDENQIFLFCYDKESRVCTVKYLNYYPKEKRVLVFAEDLSFKPFFVKKDDIIMIGRVIMVSSIFIQ